MGNSESPSQLSGAIDAGPLASTVGVVDAAPTTGQSDAADQ
jgi:hypothetical protein